MKKTIKVQILEIMTQMHPTPVHRNHFLQRFLYSFRNRLSELRAGQDINYNEELARKSLYKFTSKADYERAKEYLGLFELADESEGHVEKQTSILM